MEAQLALDFTAAHPWAFAVNKSSLARKSLGGAGRDVRDYLISACSVDARRLGVEAGMRYEQAKALIPEMKIILIGGKNR